MHDHTSRRAARAAKHAGIASFVTLTLLTTTACSQATPPDKATSATTGATARPAPQRPLPGAGVARPSVRGPITGGRYGMAFNPMPARLAAEHGYVEEEYFVAGTATAYRGDGTWDTDGRWKAVPASTAPYTTRIVVRRPTDAARFSGAVLVEWLNVSAGMDADPDFGFAHEELLRNGDAYVGVSAQLVGIEGGTLKLPIPGFEATPLKAWDPDRYGPLAHPGDEYAYDIFSQVAQAVRRPDGTDPLAGLRADYVLAAGESQSAGRMVTYVNAVHPLAGIYDGFLIHSRGSGGAAFGPDTPLPKVAHIRGDLEVPVLQLQTESDLFGLGSYAARQPDTPRLRTWEVAGTAHADKATLVYGFESGRQWMASGGPDFGSICGLVNSGQQAPVVRAAIAALRTWATGGPPPATGTPIEVAAGDAPAILRDEHGNARGGVRNPAVDAPTATLTGDNTSGGGIICSLFGATVPFDAATLARLYPTGQRYLDAVTAAADAGVRAGFLLPRDRDALVARARDGAEASDQQRPQIAPGT